MEPKYRFRLYLLTALVLTGCGTLLSRLYEFQIDRRSQFVANIPTTHTVTIREPGVRGEIVDRNGLILARNRRSYEVVFNLDDIYKSYQEQNQNDPDLTKTEITTGAGGMPKLKAEKDIVRIVNEDVIPRLEEFGLKGERFTKALRSHYLTYGGLVPYKYKTDLTHEQFAQIAVRSGELRGVEVRVAPRRIYPYGSLAGHVLGYVKQWAKGDIPDEFRNDLYEGDDEGISGVEATMDSFLKGAGGKRILVRNEKQKVIATDDYQPAREGSRVQLTIDANLQYYVENIMRQIGRGAAVVQDPNTGEILAMVSVPNYDPNDFVPSITQDRFDTYNRNRAAPLTNRAISAFIPGSTFKLPTAIAGLIHNNVGFHHNCIGYSSFGKLKIGCWKKGGHGTLGLNEAIQRSCNPYFMALAGKTRSSAMVDTFNMLGFGNTSGILLPQEDEGMFPGSKSWRNDYPGALIAPAELGMMAIGQGKTLATPLQICSVTATIANGGRYYQPRIIRRVVGEDLAGNEEVLKENIPIVKADLLKEGVTEHQLEVIRKGMWKAANEPGGTAFGQITMKDVFIAAKTGTAQVNKLSITHSHNAWTTSFAPYDSPRYAVTVLVANGKSGGKVAGALSHLIYRSIFNLEAGLKPPLGRLGIYEGNFEPYEEVILPEGDLLALPINNEGENQDDVDLGDIQSGTPVKVKPKAIPLPSIAPLPDAETEEPSLAPGQ
ncbi:MAG: penicillin-binding transpeptidase domain-containing protein [Akkermansiaceae bacterium]|jgi:penicillin-binding protein 2